MKKKSLEFMSKKEEKRWEYKLNLTFNGQKIIKLTITDHYQEKHPDIANELIISLIKMLDGIRLNESDYQGDRKAFRWGIKFEGKNYRLIFWYDDNSTNHLWIRNCYRID